MNAIFLVIIYLAFLSIGIPDSLLGAAWPVIYKELTVPLSYAGLINVIISCASTGASLLSEWSVKKLGTGMVVAFSTFLTAVAMFGFSVSTSYWMLCLSAIPYGFGAGAIDVSLNSYAADSLSSRHMNWLHCTWGVGAIISPYIMKNAILHSDWKSGYQLVGGIQLLLTLILFLALPIWKRQGKADANTRKSHSIKVALQVSGAPKVIAGITVYSAVSAICMLWTSSYLVQMRGIPEDRAAAYASLFFLGMTAGRLITGVISAFCAVNKIIRGGVLTILLGIICVVLPVKHTSIALCGFILIGLGCAPIYPLTIHSTPKIFGQENSQAIISLEMAGANISATIAPLVFSVMIQFFGMQTLPATLTVLIIISFVLIDNPSHNAASLKTH